MEIGQVVFVKGLYKYGRVAMTGHKKCKRVLIRFVFLGVYGTYYEYIHIDKENVKIV